MQKKSFIKTTTTALFGLLASTLLIACGENKLESRDPNVTDESRTPSFSGTYAGSVNIDLSAEPEITRDISAGTTEIILQFVPRNADNTPLSPEQVKVTLLINGNKIGSESLIDSRSEQLAFNVNLGLVLDASSSMAYPLDEPAFTAMLDAAKTSIETGVELWAEQEGEFSFHTTWFNNSILSSVNSESNNWIAESILDIPHPRRQLDFTRLYAASDYAIEKMAENVTEIQSNVRDQNLILIFSDGVDNKSHFNDADVPAKHLKINNNDEYVQLGWEDTSLEELIENIKSHDNVSVHVIGMGDELDINASALQSIADAGNGEYLPNPDAADLEKPFQRVIQEFTTLQTFGVITPVPAGHDYTFTLRVENATGGDSVDCSFQIRIEEESAVIVKEENEETCAPQGSD